MKRKVLKQIAAREAAELRQLQADAMEALNQLKRANLDGGPKKASIGARRSSTSKEMSQMSITTMSIREISTSRPKGMQEDVVNFATWLANGKTMEQYDPDHTGELDFPNLTSALKNFRANSWKFEGVLW